MNDNHIPLHDDLFVTSRNSFYADIQLLNTEGVMADICQGLLLSYADDVFKMAFTEEIGAGRIERNCVIQDLKNIQIILDKSIIGFF